jgi:Methyltransferase domain
LCRAPYAPGGAIIEIGSFLGLSTNIIAYLAFKHQPNNPFFASDPWVFEGTDKPIGGYFDASGESYHRYVQEVFKLNTALFSQRCKPYTIQTYSDQFFELWHCGSQTMDVFGRSVTMGGPISFAYVDGAHTYDAVRGDFMGIDPYLQAGGFILFDDSADDVGFEVTKLMAEMKRNPAYELVFKTPRYFFRKK